MPGPRANVAPVTAQTTSQTEAWVMKRAITLSIGAMALAATALPSAAADLGARPITKAPVAAPIAAYNWSGCYIGANAGGEWSRYSGDVTVGAFPGAVV